jgi:hypothetical protein
MAFRSDQTKSHWEAIDVPVDNQQGEANPEKPGVMFALAPFLGGVSHLLHMEFFTGLCGSMMPTMIRAPHTVTLTPPSEAVCRLP